MTAKGGAPEWDPESYERYALPFDKEVFKDAAMEIVMEAGVKLMLRTRICDPIMDNGKIVGVIIDNKSGMSAVLGKVVIDCSGDADLADRAGVPTVKGRESDHRMRPLTTLFRLGGSVNEFSEIADDVLEHHERWDGQGYPRGLKGGEISLKARVINVADSYDAMTSYRTYGERKSHDEAAAELERCVGTQFDPEIVRVFIDKVMYNIS